MFRSMLWICVAFHLVTCFVDQFADGSLEDNPSRRIGGPGSFNALPSEYPFAVFLRVVFGTRPIRSGWCSGSIIHPNVVLTAGHCVCRRNFRDGKPVREFLSLRQSYVSVGANSAIDAQLPRMTEIVDAKVRPEFNYRFIGDVAILRTARNMVSRAMGGLVVRRGRMDRPEKPRIVTIAGYGENHALKNTNFNSALRYGHMQTADLDECKSVIKEEWAPEKERYLCLTSYEAQSLRGDSGGPVLYKGRLVGVGKGGRTPNYSDYEYYPDEFKRYIVAERVSYYESWIDDYLARLDYHPEEFGTSEENSNPSDNCMNSDVSIIHEVGCTSVMQPKGYTTVHHKNGRETVVHPDGNISYLQPDGSTIVVSPSNITVFYADGSKRVVLPDKSVVVVRPNGWETVVPPHGASARLTPSSEQRVASNRAPGEKTAVHIPQGDKRIVLPVSVNVVVNLKSNG